MAKQVQKSKRKKVWNYPRQGYGAIHRWLPSWRIVFGTFLTMMAVGIGAFIGLYVSTDIPQPDEIALAQSTEVTYSDGKTKLGDLAEYNRTSVPLSQMSASIQNAVVASEDRSFFENNGVDVKGIARALWNNIQGKPTQGGSTLTQQYVERYYTGQNSSLPAKVKEAVLALKIDRSQSKENILQNYLNTIYFGRGAYGIQAAADSYFGVSANDLTISQSALLAGIIPAPSAWDPAVNLDRAKQRFDRVIGLLHSDGWITDEEAKAAVFPETKPVTANNSLQGTNGYLIQSVRDELKTLGGFTDLDLETGGYKIVTTFDPKMQQAAVDSVATLPEDRPENNMVSLISVDPHTGEVFAMYGGADYQKRQRNSATQDRAQAGSTFKVFGLTAAIDGGMSPNETFNSPGTLTIESPNGEKLEFHNTDRRSYGQTSLYTMTAKSLNTGYINLNKEITPNATKEMAIALGLPEKLPGLDTNIGNILGSSSPTAKEMSRAFSTLAGQGKRPDSIHVVREVTDRDGNVVYQGTTTSERVISAQTANIVTSVLETVPGPRGTAYHAGELGIPIAGKTGTSTGPVSAWFVGYTPHMVTAVNMYAPNEDGSEGKVEPFGGVYQIAGGNMPTTMWLEYMKVATEGMDPTPFPDVSTGVARRSPSKPLPSPTQSASPTPSETPSQTSQPSAPPTPSSAPEETPAPTPTSGSAPEVEEKPTGTPTPTAPPANDKADANRG